jgi:hypothetical protein
VAPRISAPTIRGLVSALIVLALALVFLIPWFMPAGNHLVVSDSQAVGFSNRTAMLGLVASCLAIAGLACLGQRSGAVAGTEALMLDGRAEPGSRVSGGLVLAFVILTTGMVLLFGMLHGDRLAGDSAYYMNAMLRVLAGGSPYSQIEFTYGPLLLYLPLFSYRVLGQAGVQPHVVYYGWVAISSVLGLLLLVYILNRIRFRAGLRSQVFAFCAICGALSPALVLAATPLRFLLPYALFACSLDGCWRTRSRWLRRFAGVLAVAFTFALSPEMGVALLVALLAAALPGLVHSSRSRELLLGLGGLLALGAVAAVFLLLPRASTFGAFAGGAFYLPVLPGLPALAFVGTMLTVSYVIGSLVASAPPADQARHLGWFALSLALVVPAFGRADFGHLLWNGMGAFILCAAMVDQRWGRGGAYIRVVGFVFISAVVMATSILLLWIRQRTEPPVSQATAEELVSYRGLCYTAGLRGDLGLRLARSGGLVPLYVNPAGAINDVQFKKAVEQLEAAKALAIPMADYDRYLNSAASGTATVDGMAFGIPADVGDPFINGLLHGFPIRLHARHPVFDPVASFGMVLKRGWRVSRLLPGYLILEQRR